MLYAWWNENFAPMEVIVAPMEVIVRLFSTFCAKEVLQIPVQAQELV